MLSYTKCKAWHLLPEFAEISLTFMGEWCPVLAALATGLPAQPAEFKISGVTSPPTFLRGVYLPRAATEGLRWRLLSALADEVASTVAANMGGCMLITRSEIRGASDFSAKVVAGEELVENEGELMAGPNAGGPSENGT